VAQKQLQQKLNQKLQQKLQQKPQQKPQQKLQQKINHIKQENLLGISTKDNTPKLFAQYMEKENQ
jgi:hypothetical protein